MTFFHLDEEQKALHIYRRCTVRKSFKIREADKQTKIQLAADDVVRFKVWDTHDAAPDLDIDSVGALAGGSIVTIDELGNGTTTDAQVTVLFDQDDVDDLAAGNYYCELAIVDNSDDDRYIPVFRGLVVVEESPTGDRGLA
jgi:hypothetical protein